MIVGALLCAGTAHASAPVEGAACEDPGAALATDVAPLGDVVRAAIEAGDLADAEARLEDALAEDSTRVGDRARVEIHVARSFARLASQTEGARAANARRRAAALFTEAAERTRESDPRLHSFALGYLGALYEGRGRLDDAATLTRRALVAADRARAPDALYRWHAQLARIARAQGNADAALAGYRRAVGQLDALRADLATTSADAALAFRAEVEPVYLELVDLLLARSESDAERRSALLVEARDVLEALKAAELRNHFRDACLDAQRVAAPESIPGTAVLYPVVLPDRVELLLSTEDGISRHRSNVDGPTLEARTRRLRQLVTKRTTRQFLPVAHELYESLIRPVEPALAGRKLSALVIVPSGALRTIPFAALRDARSGEFLIEKVPVAVTPGLSLTDPRPIDRAEATGLVAGVSEAVLGFPPLASVPEEIANVSKAFPGVTLLDQDFVVSRFEGEVRARPVNVVHVASHGEFRTDAEESFVIAHDAKIPMSQLASIVGSTRLRTDEPLELLVLSACQTAAGDDRAALGLAGVALRAGARSALATLWSVNDVAAAELITRFYAELAGGASRARALQRAQLQLLETRALRHPAYWSPFLLISSWL